MRMRDLTQNLTPQQSYLHHLFPTEPIPLIQEARAASVSLGKAPISLSPSEARLMSTLIASHQCRKFVEIGTLTGASALWILHGLLPEGELWTFEKDLDHAQLAKNIFLQYEQRETSKKVHLIEGDARVTLPLIEQHGPFDGIFIDGNKSAYQSYLDWAEKNLRPGGLILADNVFLGGSVFTGNAAQFSKKQIEEMKAFNERLADPAKYVSSIIPTGEGLFFAIKLF